MKREELIHFTSELRKWGVEIPYDIMETAIVVYLDSLSSTDINVGSKGEEELTADIKQYVTNLLYSAYEKGEECELSSEFDKWVEEQTDLIDEYLNKYFTQSHPSLTAECEHDWLYKILCDHTACNVCTKCGKIVRQDVKTRPPYGTLEFLMNGGYHTSMRFKFNEVQGLMEEYSALRKVEMPSETPIEYKYTCSKCGAWVSSPTPYEGCCTAPALYRTSGICGGQLVQVGRLTPQ